MSPVHPDLLDEDMRIIRQRRGPNSVRFGSDASLVDRIPLESPALMRITADSNGHAGVPLGRTVRLWGEPSSGKTHVAYLIMAAAQRFRSERFPEGLRAAYWNVEGVWDRVHAATLGVDVESAILVEAKIIEDIAREMELLLRSCHLHVLDSASSAKPLDQIAADADDWQRMLDARAWERALDRIEASFDNDENVLVLIDHASRDPKTKAVYAKGGKALDHASSLSIHFTRGGWLYYHPDGHLETADKIKVDAGASPSGMKEPDGAEMVVRVNKSRICRPFRAARLRFDFNTLRFDTTWDLLWSAIYFDEDGRPAQRSKKPSIVVKSGSWYGLPDGTKTQGERGLRHRIEESAELRAMIEKAMLSGW